MANRVRARRFPLRWFVVLVAAAVPIGLLNTGDVRGTSAALSDFAIVEGNQVVAGSWGSPDEPTSCAITIDVPATGTAPGDPPGGRGPSETGIDNSKGRACENPAHGFPPPGQTDDPPPGQEKNGKVTTNGGSDNATNSTGEDSPGSDQIGENK